MFLHDSKASSIRASAATAAEVTTILACFSSNNPCGSLAWAMASSTVWQNFLLRTSFAKHASERLFCKLCFWKLFLVPNSLLETLFCAKFSSGNSFCKFSFQNSFAHFFSFWTETLLPLCLVLLWRWVYYSLGVPISTIHVFYGNAKFCYGALFIGSSH